MYQDLQHTFVLNPLLSPYPFRVIQGGYHLGLHFRSLDLECTNFTPPLFLSSDKSFLISH